MDLRSHTPKGQAARAHIVASAEPLFAAHGFHGTSMRDLALAAGVPLASVVYHFARKEELYAALLQAIGGELQAALAGRDLEGSVQALVAWALRRPQHARLLLREILDNAARVEKAALVPLGPVLTELAERLAAAGVREPALAVLAVFGALSYLIAAQPTHARIVGKENAKRSMRNFESFAVAFVRRAWMTEEDFDATRSAGSARSTRARAPRTKDHR